MSGKRKNHEIDKFERTQNLEPKMKTHEVMMELFSQSADRQAKELSDFREHTVFGTNLFAEKNLPIS